MKKLAKAVEKLEAETPIHINEDGTLDYISITIERYPFAISCDESITKDPVLPYICWMVLNAEFPVGTSRKDVGFHSGSGGNG